jgi:hypothetical protein
MGDGSTVDRHDRLLPREGCGRFSPRASLGLLALGEGPFSHVVFHHGTLFELVPDGIHVVWTCHFGKLFEVIGGLPCLVLDIVVSGSDMFSIGALHFLVIIVIADGSNRNPLGAPLLLPLVLLLEHLLMTLGSAPLASAGDRLPIALDEDGPDHLFTRGVPGGDVK